MRLRILAALILIVGLLALVFYWRSSEKPKNSEVAQTYKIKIGVFPKGLQAPMFLIVKKHKFLEKHGLEPTFYEFGLLPAMTQAFLAKETDVIWVGITQAADMRNKGVPVKTVLAHANAAERVVVRADSKVKTVSDLKGRKVGTPGAGTTAHTLFGLISKGLYKIDPEKDMQMLKATEDNLSLYLIQGELDAAILKVETFAAMEEGKTRVVSVLSEEWKKLSGSETPFILLSSTFREEYVRAQHDAVRRYILAMREAHAYASEHQEELAQLLSEQFSMSRDAARRYLSDWNQVYFCELGPQVRSALVKEWESMVSAGDLTAVPKDIFEVYPEAENSK